jgi:hypothetical protein
MRRDTDTRVNKLAIQVKNNIQMVLNKISSLAIKAVNT